MTWANFPNEFFYFLAGSTWPCPTAKVAGAGLILTPPTRGMQVTGALGADRAYRFPSNWGLALPHPTATANRR